MRARRTTWLWGGVGLVVSGVGTTLSAGQFLGSLDIRVIAQVLYAAAVTLLAVGLSSASSVVARRPAGVASLVVLGVWPLAELLLVPLMAETGSIASQMAFVAAFLTVVVPIASALVASLLIGRARVVPSPWRWIPAYVLAGQSALWVLTQVSITASGGDQSAGYLRLLSALGLMSVLAGTVGLGIVAIYLSATQRPDTIRVYP